MSAIAWDTIETALVAWVAQYTGLGDKRMSWSHYSKPRPQTPYASLTISEVETIGHDWKVTEDNPSPTPGQELIVKARGDRRAIFGVQILADVDSDDGVEAARRMAVDLVGSVAIAAYDLDLAGVGLANVGKITVVGPMRNGLLEPRAVVEFTLNLASELESFITYIERVQLIVNPPNQEVWIPSPPPPES